MFGKVEGFFSRIPRRGCLRLLGKRGWFFLSFLRRGGLGIASASIAFPTNSSRMSSSLPRCSELSHRRFRQLNRIARNCATAGPAYSGVCWGTCPAGHGLRRPGAWPQWYGRGGYLASTADLFGGAWRQVGGWPWPLRRLFFRRNCPSYLVLNHVIPSGLSPTA